MGEGNSESLVTAGGCSTAQIEARNHPLNFLKPLPLGCRHPCLVQPTLPSLTGPGSQRSAVQGAGVPEAGRWVMAGPLGNPRLLSTQPGTSATAPQPSPATRTGPPTPLFPRLSAPAHHPARCGKQGPEGRKYQRQTLRMLVLGP